MRLTRKTLPTAILILAIIVSLPAHAQDSPNQDASFRIVQISDTQPTNEAQWQIMAKAVELVNGLKPDLVFFPGDITDNGTEHELRRAYQLLAKIEAPLHLVPGNHDRSIPSYRKYFGPENWSVNHGNFLFVGLDCTDHWPGMTRRRLAWLKALFLTSEKPYKILVTHFTQRDILNASPMLNDTLISGGVVALMHGHNHAIEAYRDKDKTGRLVFSSGSVVGSHGVMYFDVTDHRLNCFWQPLEGEPKHLGNFDLQEAADSVTRRRSLFDIAPYLQALQPNQVTIKWQSLLPENTAVRLMTTGGQEPAEYPVPAKPFLSELTLEQLTPATEYTCRVESTSPEFGLVQSPPVSFRTPPQQAKATTFVVYGDTRTQIPQHSQVVAAIMDNVGKQADFCLHTGDLVNNGSKRPSWTLEFFQPAKELLATMPLILQRYEGFH